ncbi:MAG TPA: hypothetical protein PK006_03830 [Saprospiraceae bacterium]|nr:hypothetical protein [Saprospiraceae bacterium]
MILIMPVLSLCSCTQLLYSVYGIKQMESLTEYDIIKLTKKYNIPTNDSYALNKNFLKLLKQIEDSLNTENIKNHYQPLQAIYYDQNRNMCSYYVNCYAGGFPNLKWNRKHSLEFFPPTTQAPIDSIISLDQFIQYFQILDPSQQAPTIESEYIILVFWSRFMGRQSKRFIRLIQHNASLGRNHKIKIIYVNNDNMFLE